MNKEIVIVTESGETIKVMGSKIWGDEANDSVSILGGPDGKKLVGRFKSPQSIYFSESGNKAHPDCDRP